MAKFNFAFEKVLGHRKTLEDLAQKDFQVAQSALNAELEKLELLQQQRTQAFESRHQKEMQGAKGQVPALTQVHDYLRLQDLRIEMQKKKIQDFEKQVESLRDILRQKAVETKMIEGLKEKKRDEFRTEQKKLEQKRLDDMVSTRFRK